jgi:hypothetical protein
VPIIPALRILRQWSPRLRLACLKKRKENGVERDEMGMLIRNFFSVERSRDM